MNVQFILIKNPILTNDQDQMATKISSMSNPEYQALLNSLVVGKYDIDQVVWWVQLARGIQNNKNFPNQGLVVARIKFFVVSKKLIDSTVFEQYMKL